MSTKPLANRLDEITRSLAASLNNPLAETQRAMERSQPREQPAPGAAAAPAPQLERPAARRVPAPPPSPLVSASIRALIQEEARLHWHHRDLPVSRFSACLLLPG